MLPMREERSADGGLVWPSVSGGPWFLPFSYSSDPNHRRRGRERFGLERRCRWANWHCIHALSAFLAGNSPFQTAVFSLVGRSSHRTWIWIVGPMELPPVLDSSVESPLAVVRGPHCVSWRAESSTLLLNVSTPFYASQSSGLSPGECRSGSPRWRVAVRCSCAAGRDGWGRRRVSGHRSWDLRPRLDLDNVSRWINLGRLC
jgi:hypothetical protein